jgi:hypothetical protein
MLRGEMDGDTAPKFAAIAWSTNLGRVKTGAQPAQAATAVAVQFCAILLTSFPEGKNGKFQGFGIYSFPIESREGKAGNPTQACGCDTFCSG